jgi:hypothetical protein
MHRLTYYRLFAMAIKAQERVIALALEDLRRRRSCGQDATSAVHVSGSAAARLSAAGPAVGAWQSCSGAALGYSAAVNVPA